jgi:hypothetical protein
VSLARQVKLNKRMMITAGLGGMIQMPSPAGDEGNTVIESTHVRTRR